MNMIEVLLIAIILLILLVFAPFLIPMMLVLLVGGAVLWLFVQIFVLFCQAALKLAGIVVKKGEIYWNERKAKQAEQPTLVELIERNGEPKP